MSQSFGLLEERSALEVALRSSGGILLRSLTHLLHGGYSRLGGNGLGCGRMLLILLLCFHAIRPDLFIFPDFSIQTKWRTISSLEAHT
jgi:hypothetical protein